MPAGPKTLIPCSYFQSHLFFFFLALVVQGDAVVQRNNRITSVKSLAAEIAEPFSHLSTVVSRFTCWSSDTREDDD